MNAATIGAWSGALGALTGLAVLFYTLRQGTISRAEKDVRARDELRSKAVEEGSSRVRYELQSQMDLLRSQLADASRDRDEARARAAVLDSQNNELRAQLLRMITNRDQRD